MEVTQSWGVTPEGKLHKIDLSQLLQVEDHYRYVWVHVEADPPYPVVSKIPGLPYHIAHALGEDESRPRSEILPTGVLANLRCVNTLNKEEIENFSSFRVWVTEKLIVTVQRRPLELARIAVKQFVDVMPETPLDLLIFFLDKIVDQMTELTCSLDDALDVLEDRIASGGNPKLARTQLSQLTRRLIMIRRYLVPQREALAKMHFEKFTWVKEANSVHLREFSESTIRILEDIDAARERANLLQESLTSISLEQTNNKIYLLSIVAVIFMPLSFVTGLLGINVGGIPGNTYKYGFWIVVGFLLMVAVFELWMLRRKKWL